MIERELCVGADVTAKPSRGSLSHDWEENDLNNKKNY